MKVSRRKTGSSRQGGSNSRPTFPTFPGGTWSPASGFAGASGCSGVAGTSGTGARAASDGGALEARSGEAGASCSCASPTSPVRGCSARSHPVCARSTRKVATAAERPTARTRTARWVREGAGRTTHHSVPLVRRRGRSRPVRVRPGEIARGGSVATRQGALRSAARSLSRVAAWRGRPRTGARCRSTTRPRWQIRPTGHDRPGGRAAVGVPYSIRVRS